MEADVVRTYQESWDGKGLARDKQQMQKHRLVEITGPLYPVLTCTASPWRRPEVGKASPPSLRGHLLELSSRDLFLKADQGALPSK